MRKYVLSGALILIALMATVTSIFAQEDTADQVTPSAWLGIALTEQDSQVVIARVQPGSPANAADLLIGDVIVSFNGEAVATAADLTELVAAAAPGETATLEILRNDEELSLEVTLGTRPDRLDNRLDRNVPTPLDALTVAEMLLNADLDEGEEGFTVSDVLNNRNPFELQAGDVITSINGQNPAELDLATLMTDLMGADNRALTLIVTRDGEELTLTGDFFGGRLHGFGPRGGERGDNRGGNRGGNGFGPGNDAPALPETPDATPEAEATESA